MSSVIAAVSTVIPTMIVSSVITTVSSVIPTVSSVIPTIGLLLVPVVLLLVVSIGLLVISVMLRWLNEDWLLALLLDTVFFFRFIIRIRAVLNRLTWVGLLDLVLAHLVPVLLLGRFTDGLTLSLLNSLILILELSLSLRVDIVDLDIGRNDVHIDIRVVHPVAIDVRIEIFVVISSNSVAA